tara:strand:- start:3130 stop:4422 length:1293 start_codon:yes stop_codon:yes gene_type:complete
MKNKNKSSLFSNLKLNSWEVEILIVGFLLISLLQIPTFLINQLSDFRLRLDVVSDHLIWQNFSIIVAWSALLLSSRIIIINLAIYVIFRSFWVGLVGLSYVFPKGINIDKLNYNQYFIKKFENYDLENDIQQIDKLCSSIFSFSFLITLTTISIIILLIELILFIYLLNLIFGKTLLLEDILTFLFLIPSTIYIFDFLSFGLMKKIKWKPFAISYYYIYLIFNYLSLGFIYNNLYYTYISNVKARYIFFPIILLISYFYFNDIDNRLNFSYPGNSKYSASYNFYENQFNNINFKTFKRPTAFIQANIIEDNYLELNIPYSASINSGLENLCTKINNIYDMENTDSIQYIQHIIECINDFYYVSIDTVNIKSDFISGKYVNKFVEFSTFNMIIPLENFKNGNHILNITNADTTITKLPKYLNNTIPFYLIR